MIVYVSGGASGAGYDPNLILLNGMFGSELVDDSCYARGTAELSSPSPGGSFGANGYTFLQDGTGSTGAKGFGWQFALDMNTAVDTTIEAIFSVRTSYGGSTGLYVLIVGAAVNITAPGYSLYVDPFAETMFMREQFFGDSSTVTGIARNTEHHIAICVPASVSAGNPVRFYINGSQFWTRSSKGILTSSVDTVMLGGITGVEPATITHDVAYKGVRITRDIVYPGGTSFTPPTEFTAPVCG